MSGYDTVEFAIEKRRKDKGKSHLPNGKFEPRKDEMVHSAQQAKKEKTHTGAG